MSAATELLAGTPAGEAAQAGAEAPKFVLLTTTSGDAAAAGNLTRMVEGLKRQAAAGARISALLLVQQDAETTRALAQTIGAPDFMETIPAGGRLSLSAARNRMLAIAEERELIRSDDVVAFPDDDSWYPDGLLPKLRALFEGDPFFDFFFCRYGTQTEACRLRDCAENPSAHQMVANASSNTIFVRGRIAKQIGGFDESLGVGAEHKAGEDLDYAVRAFHRAVQSGWVDAPLVGHRDKDPAIRAKYYGGSLLVLGRYAHFSTPMAWLFLRKLAIGAVLTVTRRLAVRDLSRAIGVALRQLSRGPVTGPGGRP